MINLIMADRTQNTSHILCSWPYCKCLPVLWITSSMQKCSKETYEWFQETRPALKIPTLFLTVLSRPQCQVLKWYYYEVLVLKMNWNAHFHQNPEHMCWPAACLASVEISVGLGIPREVSAFSMTFEIPCPNGKELTFVCSVLLLKLKNHKTNKNPNLQYF